MKLTANFRNLLFLNWRVEPELLQSRVPPGVELDRINGNLYISLVAFLFENLQIQGIPAPFHQQFEEVNLRFYVHQHATPAEKRGVVFIREIVPKSLIATTARIFFNEKYITLPMDHKQEIDLLEYSWNTEKQKNFVRAVVKYDWELPHTNSSEYLFMKRQFGFTEMKDGTTHEIQMEHPDWRISRVMNTELETDIADLFGSEFVPYLTLNPALAFVAEGSQVTINN